MKIPHAHLVCVVNEAFDKPYITADETRLEVHPLNRFCCSVPIAFVLLSVALAKPVSAIRPQIQNVVVYKVGDDTFLNITIYHYPENATISHYVDIINVTVGEDTVEYHIGVQPLTPENTFTVTYDLGPISGNPSITVQAHCTLDDWGDVWSGQVPEYSLPVIPLALTIAASIVVLARRRIAKFH